MDDPIPALLDSLVIISKWQPGTNVFTGLGHSLKESLSIAFTIRSYDNMLTS
jgi:hypothetical protein